MIIASYFTGECCGKSQISGWNPLTASNRKVQQLEIQLTLPNPRNSESTFHSTFHDTVKNTVKKIFVKAPQLQVLRSGLQTPNWTLHCQVRLSLPMILRNLKTKFKKGLTKCFEEIIPAVEHTNFKKEFKEMKFC